ncbi:MAG TPA: phasin family protein, partial [Allosphingosinicella sp.]
MADQQNQTPTAAAAVDATAKASATIAKAVTPAVTDKAEAPAAAAKAAAAPAKAAAKVIDAATATSAKPRAAKTRTAKAAKPARAATTARKAGRPAKRAAAAAATTNTATRIKNEGTRIMKKETAQVADRLQAVFGDVNERARTQIERNTRIAEEMTELSKGNVEAMVASTKVVAKGLETVGQEVAEFSRKSFEDASAALRSFAEVKSAT